MATSMPRRHGATRRARTLEASALASSSLFADATRGELEILAEASALQSAERHQVVSFEGQVLDRLYVVQSGSFKRLRQSPEGKEIILGLLGPGDAFGAVGRPVECTALVQALEASSFLSVSASAVRDVMRANVELTLRLVATMETRYQRAETAAARLAFESVPERLAALLLETCRGPRGELAFPLNQTEIASLIGSSRETVCSVLGRFRREGAIEIDRGRIRLLDRDRLTPR